jgi:GNAT superfamily N-acetyltransferase
MMFSIMLGGTTSTVRLQEFQPDQYPRLAEIYNSIYPGYERGPDEFRLDDEHLDKSKYHFRRYACLGEDSKDVIGFGDVRHGQWTFHPKKFWIDMMVDPKYQKHGAGGAIYERLNQDLTDLGAITVWVQSREDKPDSSRFLTKRGFREVERIWESHLDPATIDRARFEEYSRKAEARGIGFSTLSEEMKRDPDWERKLYELVQTVAADIPLPTPFTPVSFEQWQAFEMKSPNLLREGYMIAKDGSKYVGLSTVWRQEKKPGSLWQGLTGVRPEYRGRGIAIALKLRVNDYALSNGYGFIRTFNDSINAPMLGINIKLGFQREVGWITFGKDNP